MKQSTFLAALKMVTHAAALRDIRYYLNGVCFDFEGQTLTLVGTDGHRLAVAVLECETMPKSQVILDNNAVKQLLSLPKNTGDVLFVQEGNTLRITIAGQVLVFAGIEGRFPDWRRVVTGTEEATVSIGVNADYMSQAFASLAKVANRKYHGVKMNLRGSNCSIRLDAGLADDFPGLTEAYCIIMPMRL